VLTLEEVWSSKPADYSSFQVFGFSAYAHVNEGKLEPRAKKCIILGYAFGVKVYKFWYANLSKIIISKNITFDESTMFHPKKE